MVFLDARHHVLTVEEMFQGTLNSATVFPREIVRRALQLNAAAIVAAHNHPSGNPSPSADDRQVTRELQRACGLMDISLLDHIVIGGNDCSSLCRAPAPMKTHLPHRPLLDEPFGKKRAPEAQPRGFPKNPFRDSHQHTPQRGL